MVSQPTLHRAKVAVITRTKDRGVLLERAIKSVHQQTMPDFIHVIINDAGNPKIVDGLVDKYRDITKGRVKVIHNEISYGMEAASNKAIKSVDSEFIAIHDDDDTWHPDCLRQAIGHMESSGAMGVVVTTDKVIERIVGDTVQIVNVERWLPDTHAVNLYEMCADNYTTPITFFYRRSVYKEIGYYDENLLVCGDWDFGIRFLRKYDIDFLNTPYALAYYHLRPEVTGAAGTSVFAGLDTYELYANILANKWLREDLDSGCLGPGYFFNQAREQRRLLKAKQKTEVELTEEFRAHNIRVEASLQRVEKLIVEATSPKRVIRSAARFAKRLPRRVARKALRSVGISQKRK